MLCVIMGKKIVAFTWPHGGDSVQLAGTFNSWTPENMPKVDDKSGHHRIELTVAPGKHEFKFVVDGNWTHDEGQPKICNEVGSMNNFLEVAPESPKSTIEVERKFIVPGDYRTRLPEAGFSQVKEFEESLSDTYHDTEDFDLLEADHWLRKRNGDWELKYPVGSINGSPTTRYHETR